MDRLWGSAEASTWKAKRTEISGVAFIRGKPFGF